MKERNGDERGGKKYRAGGRTREIKEEKKHVAWISYECVTSEGQG
jgi:hypothetical protein